MTVLPYSIDEDTITAHIYTDPIHSFSSKIAVLFLLHGHPSSARHMKPIVNGIFDLTTKMTETAFADSNQNLVIVTLDLKPADDQERLDESESERLYRQQERMAESVSALIDRLPSLLSPNYDKIFDTWMVAGVSLGAHAAWLAIDRDPRLSVCIPVIGSPDFLDIATQRSSSPGVPLVSSYMSSSIRNYIIKNDPVSRKRSPSQQTSFMNKHVLALAGAQDGMIPLLATRAFLDRIDVGPAGTKRLVIQQGVGHQCTREMVREMAKLVWKVVLA
ncbi:hypothetical protein FRC07_014800 [Ceratobasidium sp. 392]|nr:hypothetical protein FRC07_014800 [Ceratobasidium sp. 392]